METSKETSTFKYAISLKNKTVYLMVVDRNLSLGATKLYACHMSSGSSGISPTWLNNNH